MEYLIKNKLITDKQFGFLGGRSTLLQLLHVMEDWTKILDDGGNIDVVYCDFMKAFDKVPHTRLLSKLESYGIQDPVLSWIRSFLTGRSQKVVVNGSKSKPAEVRSGIPQGSVLGPLLFVIYINDLPDAIGNENSHIYMFADDTKVYRKIQKEADTEALQSDIKAMYDWSNKWLLKFHPEKCQVMRIGNKTSPPLKEYYMENHPLSYSSCEKDIGVFVDDKLRFREHIENKVKKANSLTGIIRRTFDYMDKDIFNCSYKALIRPNLEYANQAWSTHYNRDKETLESVQRRATKLVPGLAELPYSERLKALNLHTLSYRRLRGDMIECFKMLHPNCGYDKSLNHILELNK